MSYTCITFTGRTQSQPQPTGHTDESRNRSDPQTHAGLRPGHDPRSHPGANPPLSENQQPCSHHHTRRRGSFVFESLALSLAPRRAHTCWVGSCCYPAKLLEIHFPESPLARSKGCATTQLWFREKKRVNTRQPVGCRNRVP